MYANHLCEREGGKKLKRTKLSLLPRAGGNVGRHRILPADSEPFSAPNVLLKTGCTVPNALTPTKKPNYSLLGQHSQEVGLYRSPEGNLSAVLKNTGSRSSGLAMQSQGPMVLVSRSPAGELIKTCGVYSFSEM